MKYFKLILICAFLVMSNSYAQTKIMTFNIRYSTPNDGDNYWELRKDEILELLEYYNMGEMLEQNGCAFVYDTERSFKLYWSWKRWFKYR